MRSSKAAMLAPPPGTVPVPAKVTLDAFIISTTPYDVLIKQRPDMDKPRPCMNRSMCCSLRIRAGQGRCLQKWYLVTTAAKRVVKNKFKTFGKKKRR